MDYFGRGAPINVGRSEMDSLGRRSVPAPIVALGAALLGLMVFGSGSASAAHVSCGETITTDTTLDSDLTNCAVGVEIDADNITLDLKGHTIEGDGTGGGDGVRIAGQQGVVVKNGTIKEFGTSVALVETPGAVAQGANNNRVEQIIMSSNAVGIILIGAHNNQLRRNDVSGNATGIVLSTGFEAPGPPANPRSSGNVLVRNRVSRNTDDGIVLKASSSNRLARNEVSGNGANGIELAAVQGRRSVFTSNVNLLVRNRVSRNKEHGIVLDEGSSGNRLLGNTTNRNLEGIDLKDSSNNNSVLANEALGNDDDGIEISSSSDNHLAGNRASRNGDDGFNVQGPSNNNRLEMNVARDNNGNGLFFAAASTATLLRRNRAHENGDDGIDVESASTTLTRNRTNRNVDLGIEAVAGVTDGGTNRAAGNGNPAQCLNVACSP